MLEPGKAWTQGLFARPRTRRCSFIRMGGGGKLSIAPTKPLKTQLDLSLALFAGGLPVSRHPSTAEHRLRLRIPMMSAGHSD